MKKTTLRAVREFLRQKELFAGQGGKTAKTRAGDTLIEHISCNSLDVRENTLFFCKGAAFREDYLREAFQRGAVCYIAEEAIIEELPHILVTDIRRAMAEVSGMFYEHIWNEKLQMVGITGTKGKTTTACFLKAILDAHCRREGLKGAGLLTGVYRFDGKRREKSEEMTTPEALELHGHLAECAENGLEYLVMEASSQGFKYHRTDGLRFKVGCFLNLTEDHISEVEHRDMEDYFTSKLRIVEQSETVCVNADMEAAYRDRVIAEAKRLGRRVFLFGKDLGRRELSSEELSTEERLCGHDIKAGIDELQMKVSYRGAAEEIKVNIGGYYNADNALAAAAAALALGVSFESIREGLADVRVPGRMEIFKLPDKDVKVVVDYAHNKMSYEALFRSVNEAWPGRKKLFLFGCTGVKGKNRRRVAGEIADREADKVIITEYSYGSEPFENICADIMAHISPGKDVEIIKERERAAERSLEAAGDGWVVVMAGFSTGSSLRRENGPEEALCDTESVLRYINSHGR